MAVRRRGLLVVAVVCLVSGCQPAPSASPPPSSVVVAAPTTVPTTTTTTTTAKPTTPTKSTTTTTKPAVTGKVVVLDPGHNGGNASHLSEINRLVPAGRGQTKPCNTTGTATNGGYPEHAFTWDVTKRVQAILVAHGVKVVLTRSNDSGVGPCVDKRAAAGNSAHADAVVSIHADGSTATSAHGFHVAYSSPPLNAEQGAPSIRLAEDVRDAMVHDGYPTSTYIGSDGLSKRNDLGGLNLSTRPAVLVECGNMRNATEAAAMTSAGGRQGYAEAIAAGILSYLG